MSGSNLQGEFYVYELVDSRTDTVFYVGKGKGKRVSKHVKAAKRGEVGLKADMIREILAEPPARVIERIVKRFDDESKAYAYEERLIAKYGQENLTNQTKGGSSMDFAAFRKRKEARDWIPDVARWIRVIAGASPQSKGLNLLHEKSPQTLPAAAKKVLLLIYGVLGDSEMAKLFRPHGIFIENRIQGRAV